MNYNSVNEILESGITKLRFRCTLTTLSSTVGRIYIKYI